MGDIICEPTQPYNNGLPLEMTERSNVLRWQDLLPGMTVNFEFQVSQADMEAFAQLSGDRSRIHIELL